MATVTYSLEYRVSERVTLRPGDQFRATGGPYYVTRDEAGRRVKLSMAARGPFRFVRLATLRRKVWIEAHSSRDGGAVVLALTPRRSVMPGVMVARPYRVTGRVGTRKAAGRAPRKTFL